MHQPVVAVEMEHRVIMKMVLVFKDVMKVFPAICVSTNVVMGFTAKHVRTNAAKIVM